MLERQESYARFVMLDVFSLLVYVQKLLLHQCNYNCGIWGVPRGVRSRKMGIVVS